MSKRKNGTGGLVVKTETSLTNAIQDMIEVRLEQARRGKDARPLSEFTGDDLDLLAWQKRDELARLLAELLLPPGKRPGERPIPPTAVGPAWPPKATRAARAPASATRPAARRRRSSPPG